jgi:Cu/Ag efflux pump CusA
MIAPLYPWSKDEAQIIKAAWATDPGRLALNLVVERLAGLMGPAFDSDALVMAHREGRRSVGVDLMRAINMKIEQLVKEDNEPRSSRIATATERAERAADAGPVNPRLRR